MEFNHTTLEKDIERLGREVAEQKSRPENKGVPEREIVRQVITPVVKTHLPPTPAQAPAKNEEDTFLPSYTKTTPADTKHYIEQLLEGTFHEGLEKTIKKAIQAGPFVVDAYHDALIDKLHDELKKRNIL